MDIPLGKLTNTYNKTNFVKKKLYFKLNDFIPFKTGKMYSRNFLIPKNFVFLLRKKYGTKWSSPNKKEQLYFV